MDNFEEAFAEFMSWLERNQLKEPFMEAFKNEHGDISLKEYFKDHGVHPLEFLFRGFFWSNTRQGYDFWDRVDDYWIEFLESRKETR